MQRLTTTLRKQMAKHSTLDAPVATNLRELGYGGWATTCSC